MSEKTSIDPYTQGDCFVAYVVNTSLSPENQQIVGELQQKFVQTIGGLIVPAQLETLHITLFDWVAPLMDYGRDKDELYKEISEEYDAAVTQSLEGVGPITVTFDTIGVSPSGIFIRGHDDGQFEKIRQRFLNKVTLPEGAKAPPTIIHSSIARYNAEEDIQPVKECAENQNITFAQKVDRFNLVHSDMLTDFGRWQILKTYNL